MVNVRFANSDDVDFLLKNTQLTSDQINSKIQIDELIIASNNSNKIGLLVLDKLWSHIPFIAYIWVSEENRGHGVGKDLLKFLEDYLTQSNEKTLFSSSMENALKSQAWHKKMGFKETGIIHNINDNNIGEVFFRKDLV